MRTLFVYEHINLFAKSSVEVMIESEKRSNMGMRKRNKDMLGSDLWGDDILAREKNRISRIMALSLSGCVPNFLVSSRRALIKVQRNEGEKKLPQVRRIDHRTAVLFRRLFNILLLDACCVFPLFRNMSHFS